MNVVGIETSCDETAVAIVKDGRKIISSVVASQVEEHSLYGGVVPEIASRRHIEKINSVFLLSLKKANICLKEIDLIAVTNTPGLVGSLLVGVNFAKGLSFSLKKPLVAVNHLKAHVAANYIKHIKLTPPFIALIISGGHTSIFNVKNYCNFKLVGKTIDDSIGETYDKVGRALGFKYPAGAKIDEISKLGDENRYSFPKPNVQDNIFNFSFSGLKTAALNMLEKERKINENFKIEDFAASLQNVIADIVCEKIFKAANLFKQKKLVVCGGVCANSKIRKTIKQKAKILRIDVFMPDLEFCTDNAAMVAAQGYFEFKNKNFETDYSLNAIATSIL